MKKRWIWLIAVLVIILAIAAEYLDSNFRLVTEEYTVTDPRIPEELSGLRIVHLSDLHETVYGRDNSGLLDAVRAAEPDIICITGDLISGERSNKAAERLYAAETVAALSEIAPIYYVSGNHEWASGWARELFDLIREVGGTVLRAGYASYGSGDASVIIAGCDDRNALRDQKTPQEVLAGVRRSEPDKYVIMLYHRPEYMDIWGEAGADLVLCGHAHGGMVRLPLIGALYAHDQGLFPKYTSGVYEKNGAVEIVSRGAGGIKLRFLNNPEIAVVTLIHGNAG